MQNNCHDLLLTSLTDYYNNNPSCKEVLMKIIKGEHKLSLRLIDWFVTHYTKNFNTSYWIDLDTNKYFIDIPENINNKNIKRITLYLDYRAQLKSFTKINFDSFRRHSRITFFLDIEKEIFIDTTVGQLNFFRWIFRNNILDYILDNYNDIYSNMINNNIKCEKTNKNTPQGITKTMCTLHFD